jgi:hypothetical protein
VGPRTGPLVAGVGAIVVPSTSGTHAVLVVLVADHVIAAGNVVFVQGPLFGSAEFPMSAEIDAVIVATGGDTAGATGSCIGTAAHVKVGSILTNLAHGADTRALIVFGRVEPEQTRRFNREKDAFVVVPAPDRHVAVIIQLLRDAPVDRRAQRCIHIVRPIGQGRVNGRSDSNLGANQGRRSARLAEDRQWQVGADQQQEHLHDTQDGGSMKVKDFHYMVVMAGTKNGRLRMSVDHAHRVGTVPTRAFIISIVKPIVGGSDCRSSITRTVVPCVLSRSNHGSNVQVHLDTDVIQLMSIVYDWC